jgi:NADH dehydrogenase/NADH:ubiquinone oxidoreductase subunit G
MVKLTVNGKVVQANEGEMLLAAIRREHIDVPALCHHEAVEPYGGCRLCMVEITREDWDGWTKQVTSCLYPVEEGLIVTTHSAGVIELRKTIIDLYLARSPKSAVIIKLAAEYGLTQTSYEVVIDGNDCILCGLCTRVCDTLGFSAIAAVGRGHGKEIAPPLNQAPPDCTGCLSCAKVCPTGFIKFEKSESSLEIWGKQFDMIPCGKCGKTTVTREFAEHLSRKRDIPMSYFETCDDCHRGETALTMGRISNWSREPQT